MKTQNSQSSIQDNRGAMSEALRSLDPRICLAIGLVFSAVIGYYVPAILIALTGVWVNDLTMVIPLLLSVTVLIVQNLIGNHFNKILLTGIVLGVALDGYYLDFMLRTAVNPTWHDWWMVYFAPPASCILNAWLFLKFKKTVLD